MNNIWSNHVQGINTLYYSRKLRFNESTKVEYINAFGLDLAQPIKILEIGCGPGALALTLANWYKNAEITAIDRDSNFINFAKRNSSNINFLVGDATKLPFDDNSFDVTISYTVAEHINPQDFYREQHRVLKKGGVCLVLSAKNSVNIPANCLSLTDKEVAFWQKVDKIDNNLQKYNVGKYLMRENELPACMQSFGFKNISTEYVTINLTPDSSNTPKDMAYDIINAERLANIDSVNNALISHPQDIAKLEADDIITIINNKYDERLSLYDKGNKQWDTNISTTMIVKGFK